MKNTKGITLIALVITIIVLLILAGISISMLSGDNSILSRAADTKKQTKERNIAESVQLAYAGALSNGNGTVTEELLRDELDKNFDSYTLDFENKKVTIDEKVYGIDGDITAKTLVQAFKDGEIQIGDYVNYMPSNINKSITVTANGIKDSTETGVGTGYGEEQTYTVDTTSEYKTTWRVLGLNKEGTNLVLISGSPIRKTGEDPYLVLQGAESYIYCKKTLDAICNIYANNDFSDEVRSINIEDVNNALGVEVIKDTNGTPTKVYEISDESTNIDEYYGENSYTYKIGDYAPEIYLETGTKKAGDKEYRTAYWYSKNNVKGADNKVKDLIFLEAPKSSFISSPASCTTNSYAVFSPGVIADAKILSGGGNTFRSNNIWRAIARAVRPVVVLKSSVTIEQINKTSGEEINWTTSTGNRDVIGTFDTTKSISE